MTGSSCDMNSAVFVQSLVSRILAKSPLRNMSATQARNRICSEGSCFLALCFELALRHKSEAVITVPMQLNQTVNANVGATPNMAKQGGLWTGWAHLLR